VIYVLTVNYHSTQWVAQLIASIQAQQESAYSIVVVNNSPADPSIQAFATDSIHIIQATHNLGFGRACNLGLHWVYDRDPGAIIWLLNPDASVSGHSLADAVAFFQAYPEVSILGTVIDEPSDRIWFAGGRFIAKFGSVWVERELDQRNTPYQLTDWVSGCSLLINSQNFSTYPRFCPDYFLYYEDFDFCYSYAKQGHIVAITGQIVVRHHPSSITNQHLSLKLKHSTYSYLLMLERYTNLLALVMRLGRLVIHAIAIAPFRPQIAIGKFQGIGLYLKRVMVI
jgi:N-acetylglucosaminyl-diphospho-decaprenol L-rhamnosyltransferase